MDENNTSLLAHPDTTTHDLSDLIEMLTKNHESSQESRLSDVKSLAAASAVLEEFNNADAYTVIFDRIQKGEITGDADDFHNIAVTFARHQEPERASLICQTGLSIWPGNIDLNADALTYIMDAGDLLAANRLAESLQANCPDRSKWNWRGFSFLFDYFLEVQPKGFEKEIDTLISEYKRYLPQEEKAFLCDAKRYENMGEVDNAINSLEEAVSNLNAPQCALKLTDMYFERAKYQDAVRTATLGIAYAAEPQPSIRTAYLLFLRALSKDALFLKSGCGSSEDAKSILKEYSLARKYVSTSERKIIDFRMDIINTYSSFSISEDNHNYEK